MVLRLVLVENVSAVLDILILDAVSVQMVTTETQVTISANVSLRCMHLENSTCYVLI